MINDQQFAIDQRQNTNGHYKVQNKIFYHKLSALLEAKQKNVRPTWHFHREVYEKLNWVQDTDISLEFLYQQRARQLRQKYDYLTLSFSGGSDSWTALKAFIDSNTFLDQIFVRWPLAATKGKYTPNTKNLHPSNILSEWDFTLLPMLTEISKIIPKTKIEIHDWSDDLINFEICDDHWLWYNDYLNPGYLSKIKYIGVSEQKILDRGKSSAMIFGDDKPQLYAKDNAVYCYFLDKLASKRMPPGDYRTSELFYWSPDVPEITLTQSRKIFNFLKKNPQHLSYIDKSQPYRPETKYIWDQLVRPIIYPEYCSMKTFQAKKSGYNIYDEIDGWMLEHKNLNFFKSWESGINNVLSSVGNEYIEYRNNVVSGLSGFIDGDYFLGTID